jgi:ABC-type spermidine/putrescine transport system permease subunit I
VVSERLSMPLSGVAPELRRRERNTRLIGLALLVPAALLAAGFLYYPLLFIIQMSFTEGSSYLSQAGPVQTVDNYRLIFERYLPNLFVTVQLAFLATIVDLVLGFPFAYILVRRVRDLHGVGVHRCAFQDTVALSTRHGLGLQLFD